MKNSWDEFVQILRKINSLFLILVLTQKNSNQAKNQTLMSGLVVNLVPYFILKLPKKNPTLNFTFPRSKKALQTRFVPGQIPRNSKKKR